MRRLLHFLLHKPILWLVARFDSSPDRERVFGALSKLKEKVKHKPGKKGFVIPLDGKSGRVVILSDQHKGSKNGADDFAQAESSYLAALDYYERHKYHLIILGDSEELWENTLQQVKKNNVLSFEAEKKFVNRKAFTKIFGNHDLDWEINPMAPTELKELYGSPIIALEAVTLQVSAGDKILSFFCTHGHQGDNQSDGNFFSKFFVSNIWAPLQAYLRINPNTPAYNVTLKSKHNTLMYEWSSSQQDLILITGHTHQPVFESLTHFERTQREQHPETYRTIKPCYFNTGCCCFADGDITGIEIGDDRIALIKWGTKTGKPQYIRLEETTLEALARKLN